MTEVIKTNFKDDFLIQVFFYLLKKINDLISCVSIDTLAIFAFINCYVIT